ncbi:MAG: hypothetical protein V7754_18930 [Halioglobus sp.]
MEDFPVAVDQKRIREIIGEREEQSDTTLRGNSLRRAVNGKVPRTMTAFEWEQWYAEYGMPDELKIKHDTAPKPTWWARVKYFLRLRRG